MDGKDQVVIIGAGPIGLYTALKLATESCQPTSPLSSTQNHSTSSPSNSFSSSIKITVLEKRDLNGHEHDRDNAFHHAFYRRNYLQLNAASVLELESLGKL